MTTVIAATSTNMAAAETPAGIYHGTRAPLDISSVNEETALLVCLTEIEEANGYR